MHNKHTVENEVKCFKQIFELESRLLHVSLALHFSRHFTYFAIVIVYNFGRNANLSFDFDYVSL